MELTVIGLITFVTLILLVRSKIRGEKIAKKNAYKSSETLIEANTAETGHSHSYYVTKDPDQYAQIFVPERAKK